MKAIIYNSGIGKRMGKYTEHQPKCMVKLANGESIFERQLRILSSCGIQEFVITTGPYEEQLKEVTKKARFRNLTFHFVRNEHYLTTNYIYSLYLARDLIDDDFLSLHGDLVFDRQFVVDFLKDPRRNLCAIHPTRTKPEKDFKGRIQNGELKEVSISIFDEDCYTFQPFYKLEKETFLVWIKKIEKFIEVDHIQTVYAENAFNQISHLVHILPFSYENHFVEEIDNEEDYLRITREIKDWDYKQQPVYYCIEELKKLLQKYDIRRPFIVLDAFLKNNQDLLDIFASVEPTYFSSFHVNPLKEDVLYAKKEFLAHECDGIISIGGGSAMDTAKVVKLFLCESSDSLGEEEKSAGFAHIALPTTAGTGSESTRHAVIYEDGKKCSICREQNLPDAVILDARFLKTLPERHKKATYFDALCQAIESMWSMRADEQSVLYSKWAIQLLLTNREDYFQNHHEVDGLILQGANFAGKAINRTTTTAAHAMSYALTHEYGIPHGEAVALCLPGVWKVLLEKKEQHCRDLSACFALLRELFHTTSDEETLQKYIEILKEASMTCSLSISEKEIDYLTDSVNLLRLSNFPYPLSKEEIRMIYRELVQK